MDYLNVDRGAPSKIAAVGVCTMYGIGTAAGKIIGGWAGYTNMSESHLNGDLMDQIYYGDDFCKYVTGTDSSNSTLATTSAI